LALFLLCTVTSDRFSIIDENADEEVVSTMLKQMKKTLFFLTLLSGSFILTGCVSDYGPASPDYYPSNYPPFTQSQPPASLQEVEGTDNQANNADNQSRLCSVQPPQATTF